MASRILDRDFKYRNADSTDVRRTFARIRKALRKQRAGDAQPAPEPKPLPQPKQILKGARSR